MEIEPEEESPFTYLFSKERLSLFKALKASVFEAFYILFHSRPGKISNYRKASFALMSLLQSIQVMSFLSVGDNTDLWSTYGFMWEMLSFLRIDHVFAVNGFFRGFCLFIEISVLLLTAFFLAIVLLVFYQKAPKDIIIRVTRAGFAIYVEFCFFPVVIVLEDFIFYSVRDHLREGWTLNIPFASLALLLFYILSYLFILGSNEIRHSEAKNHIKSKSVTKVEIYKLNSRLGIATLYVLNPQVLYISFLLFITEAYLAYNYFVHKPYYNTFSTKISIVSSLMVSFSGLSMIMGRIIDNTGVFILLAFVVNPAFVSCVLWWISPYLEFPLCEKKLKLLSENPKYYTNFIEVEHCLRPFLLLENSSYKDLIISGFSQYFESSNQAKNNFLVVWEANYCLSRLHDERLSRIKLSKRFYCNWSIEGDFQVFLCLKYLELDNENYYGDFDFLKFRLTLENNKMIDKKICEKFLELLEELTEPAPKMTKVHNLIRYVSKNITEVDTVYKNLCQKYSVSNEVVMLYLSFLNYVRRDKERSNHIEQIHGQRKKQKKVLNWFDENNGLMIISGDSASIGTIIYANVRSSEILREPIISIVGRNIDCFLPHPFNLSHSKYLKRYLMNCKDTRIAVPSSLVFINSNQNLIEAYGKLRCLAIDSWPLFMVLLRDKNKLRHLAMVGKEGLVTSHSDGLPYIIKNRQIIGMNMQDFLNSNAEWHEGEESSFYVYGDYQIHYYEKKIVTKTMSLYRFYKLGTVLTKMKSNCSKYNQVSPKMNTNPLRSTKNVRFQCLEENDEEGNCSSEMVEKRTNIRNKKALKTETQTKRFLSLLTYAVLSLMFFTIVLNFVSTIYTFEGSDIENIFYTRHDLWEINMALIKLLNSARNYNLTSSDIYLDSYLESIRPFERFTYTQDRLISQFEACGSRDILYDNDIYYWEDKEIKNTNIINFSNKLVQHAYDFFLLNQDYDSYSFIIKNANSYPLEYLARVSRSLNDCYYKKINSYNIVLSMIFIVGSICIVLVIIMVIHLLLQIRKLSIMYWEVILETLSETYMNCQSSLWFRLENVHAVDDPKEIYKSLNRAKWNRPPVSVVGYIWKAIILCVAMTVYVILFFFYLNANMVDSIESRIHVLNLMGNASVSIQELNHWTREIILEESIVLNPDPLKSPKQHFDEAHQRFKDLTKKITKERHFSKDEFEEYFDRTNFGDFVFFNGIYGEMKVLLIDSIYYTGAKDKNAYLKLNERWRAIADLEVQGFHKSVNYSIDNINGHKNNILWSNILFSIFIVLFLSVVYIPFIRSEKQTFYCKKVIFEIVNSKDSINVD